MSRQYADPKFYISSTFSWDFTPGWKEWVDLAKSLRCRFNSVEKYWIVPDFTTAQELARALLNRFIDPDKIICRDPASKNKVPVREFVKPDFLARRKAVSTLGRVLSFEGTDTYLSMPLDSKGEPALEDEVFFGLASIGCEGQWVNGQGFLLTQNAAEATEFLSHDKNLIVKGIPKLPERPFILDCLADVTLFPHQEAGVTFLVNRKGGLLCDDMGLGKTAQAIIAAAEVIASNAADHLIVICPVSLIGNWENEVRKWQVLSREKITIIPYSKLNLLSEILPEGQRFVLICDEAHYLKNPVAARTKTMIRFVKSPKVKLSNTWLLTGTPITNKVSDLWTLAHLIDHPVAKKFGPSALDGLRQAMITRMHGAMKTHMLIRKKGDVLDLPEKMRQIKNVVTEIDAEVHKHLAVLAFGENALVIEHLMRLKRLTAEAKVEHTIALAQQILAEGRKVVIFSDHRHSLDSIATSLYPHGVVRIDGSVEGRERTAIVDRFQRDVHCRVFLGQCKAAGVGLTLTAASDVIFNDFPWVPSDVHQAEDRVHRIGQTGTVNIYYIADELLILDKILLRKLAEKSADIATFEQHSASLMAEVRDWAKAQKGAA